MMATALLSLSALDKIRHGFEYFIGSAHILVDKMFVVELQEPVIEFVLL